MIYDRKFQTIIIREDLQRRIKNRYMNRRRKTLYEIIIEKIKVYLIIFLETSSIHGLRHLIVARRHPCEVFLWFTVLVFSLFGTVYISTTTWSRYQSSPTVISMERDMFAWNTSFPCVTICPHKKIDSVKLDNYLRDSNEVNKKKLKTFIEALVSANFENFNNLPEYDAISPDKYFELVLNVSYILKTTITGSAPGLEMQFVPTITEMGLCYSINSKVAEYNSPEYRQANRWDLLEPSNFSSLFVHPLDGEVYAHVKISSPYHAYIHGPLEVPDVSTKSYHSPADLYMTVYVTAVTVYTAPEAASLSVNQRRCRFQHENNLRHNSVYSYTLCRIECRIRLCLKYCGCIPHFYRRNASLLSLLLYKRWPYSLRSSSCPKAGWWATHSPESLSRYADLDDIFIDIRNVDGDEKICDVNGLKCLFEHKGKLLDVKGGKSVNCKCFPLCDDVNYVIQTLEWMTGTTFQWGIVTYPRMRYKRDVIFGFTDVLVAVGGMAGLFFGCSVLSFVEVIYFLTLRLICYTKSSIKK